mmetsp:Transcript_31183/g.47094  ORF Transcript_31183/g.47094 Transcript_31183/m.47094 type:complete len:107 (+) Transcript_31183:194-514(+)
MSALQVCRNSLARATFNLPMLGRVMVGGEEVRSDDPKKGQSTTDILRLCPRLSYAHSVHAEVRACVEGLGWAKKGRNRQACAPSHTFDASRRATSWSKKKQPGERY